MAKRTPPKKQESSVNKPAVVTLGISTLVIAAGAMWYFSGPRVDRQVAAVEAMGAQLFGERGNMSDEDRRAAFSQMREAYEQLSPEQRSELRERRAQEFQRREDQRMREFFKMSKEEQVEELDRRIDQMEEWRREREQRRNQGQAGGRGDRGGNRGGGGFAGGGGRGGGEAGGGGRGGGWGGPGGGGRGGERLNERRQDRLNSTTADQRGRRTEYSRMMRERRQQRGMG